MPKKEKTTEGLLAIIALELLITVLQAESWDEFLCLRDIIRDKLRAIGMRLFQG